MNGKRAIASAVVVALAAACEPSLDQRTFLVASPRVLAVRSDPAEALPGDTVTLTSLYVDAGGAIAGGPFDWAFCEDRNPLANLNAVSPTCSTRAGGTFLELGGAPTTSGAIPADACRQFGPDVPSALPGQPQGRPVDPDGTGGYYQPVRLAAGADIAVGLVRITCSVAGATSEQVSELSAHTHPNTNPAIDAVADPSLGTLVDASEGTSSVHVAQRLSLRASWAACDPAAKSCTGSEGYAFLDPQSHEVVVAREQMRVSWFATAGSFDDDRTGRDATDPTPYTDDVWTAPATPGTAHLWVVVRDDRGGVGWRSFVLDVK